MTQVDCENKLTELFSSIDLYFWSEDVGQDLISKEMTEFNKPECGYWYEIKHIPKDPETTEIGPHSVNKWEQIMQINICVYKDIKTRRSTHTEYDVEFYTQNAYNAIAEVMKRGVIIDKVRITKIGKSSAQDGGDYYFVPVSVYWYAFLQN